MTHTPTPILVSVLCTAYNHEPYLRQCLDSIVAQQTTFSFELIVHEDASTDGTRAIVEEYAARFPHIVRPIYQTENQYSKYNGDIYRPILFPAVRGQYIAICEGDDYWTDPAKLQKEVDILEKDSACGLVCSYWTCYRQADGVQWERRFPIPDTGRVYEEVLTSRLPVGTLTAIFRTSLISGLPPFDARTHHCGDTFWFGYIAASSEVRILPESTATYRILPDSACHHTDKRRHIHFMYKAANTFLSLMEYFPIPDSSRIRTLRKKRMVDIYKEALATGDLSLIKDMKIPFFPLVTLKKTIYTLLSRCCPPSKFGYLSAFYNRHLDRK